MKKINLLVSIFTILFTSLNFYAGGNPFQFSNGNLNLVPDVMNYVNVLSDDGSTKVFKIESDSFPVFPGFPKHISGNSLEGSIFCNMDSDSDMEILFCIGFTIQAWNVDGSSVPGWPVSASSYALEGAPAAGDIDGDGQVEIVATNHGLTSGGFIYAFEKNGTPVTGFPINHGYSTRTPVLADMNNDGALDIIVNKRLSSAGEVYVYRSNGTILAGWPKPINHVPASSAAVGDVNGDGSPEIVMESYSSLYVWKANGDTLPGFPFIMPNGDVNSYSSPVLADLDGDGKREIIFGTHALSGGGYVYVLKFDGSMLTGWPKQTSQWIYGPPAVGFIDNDNLLDIAVGDQVLSGSPSDFIYAWNKNGVSLTNFPVGPLNAINNQIVLADIDNDNSTELIIDDNSTSSGMGKYLAFNHDGTPVSGFEVNTTGSTFFVTPCLGDLNGNGTLDMIGAGKEGVNFTNVYVWNMGITFNPSKIYIPMWQYNSRHNGVYGDLTQPLGITSNQNGMPGKYSLGQNYPNPFNPSTIINYKLAGSGDVNLVIYDVMGREIQTLVNQKQNAGTYEAEWNAVNYPSGVYFYKLSVYQTGNPAADFVQVNKMVLVK